MKNNNSNNSNQESSSDIKITVKCAISPKDPGIRALQREFREYKKTLAPKIQEAVRPIIKDKSIRIMSQQKWMVDQQLNRYIKNLPLHPMPFHNQSVWIERVEGDKAPSYYLHFKTKEGEAVCLMQVPKKHRNAIGKASGGGFGSDSNPRLGQVELIEDNKYGRINAHIVVKLDKPEPYEPQGWVGVDVGWNKLACSIYCGNNGEIKDPTVHGKNFKTRIIRLKKLLKERQRSKSAKKKWNNRLQNTIKYATGVVAKEIVKKANKHKAGVVMEDLTFRAHTKQFLIPRYKLMQAVKTHCERKGVPFQTVSPHNTSITCVKCGYKDRKNRNGARFNCLNCRYQADADVHAAMNLGRAAIDTGLAPVSNMSSRTGSEETGDVATPQAQLEAFR